MSPGLPPSVSSFQKDLCNLMSDIAINQAAQLNTQSALLTTPPPSLSISLSLSLSSSISLILSVCLSRSFLHIPFNISKKGIFHTAVASETDAGQIRASSAPESSAVGDEVPVLRLRQTLKKTTGGLCSSI